jgi:probable HAF family extracellular repeat protein
MIGRRRQRLSICVRTMVVLGGLGFSVTSIPAQSPPLQYAVTPIGALGGATSAAFDTAEFTQVMVGSAQTASGATHAFAQGFDGLIDLGTLGGRDSVAFTFAAGRVAGQAQTASGQQRAFVYDLHTRTMTNLGTLGGTWSAAYGVHYESVVGASRIAGDARVRAFRYQGGTMSALPVDLGGDSAAKGTNGADIVGYSCVAGNTSCRAFLFSAGTATYFGSTTGKTVGNDINSNSEIVGSFTVGTSTGAHAFLRDANGTMTDLETLGGTNSEALGINELGDIVGTSQNSAGAPRAFVWRDGVMTNLNTLIPSGSGWILETATGISDSQQIVGTGLFNGVRRAYLLTPPVDLTLFAGGSRSQEDTNLPRGIEVGHHVNFVTSALGASGQAFSVYGATMTHTLTGPAEFVKVRIVEAPDTCELTPKVITCHLFLIDTAGTGREVWTTAKATGTGAISHRVTLTTNVADPNTANNTLIENNRAVALANFTLTPSTVAGGKGSAAEVTLTDLPPAGDAVVQVTSSRPDIASVPSPFIVPAHAGTRTRTFNITPKVVAAPTTVDITATYGLVSVTRTLTVVPPKLQQLYLTPTTIVGGCGTSSGRILLTGAAPAGGAVVPLTNTNTKAKVPATVTVPAGASSTTFSVPTNPVTTPSHGTVTAAYGGASQTLDVAIRPIRAKSLTLSPSTVRGGTSVSASIVLECPAVPGAIAVSLTSSNASVAAPTQSSITIPVGATTGSFAIKTSAVTVNTPVTINVWVFGVRKSATLTITP